LAYIPEASRGKGGNTYGKGSSGGSSDSGITEEMIASGMAGSGSATSGYAQTHPEGQPIQYGGLTAGQKAQSQAGLIQQGSITEQQIYESKANKVIVQKQPSTNTTYRSTVVMQEAPEAVQAQEEPYTVTEYTIQKTAGGELPLYVKARSARARGDYQEWLDIGASYWLEELREKGSPIVSKLSNIIPQPPELTYEQADEAKQLYGSAKTKIGDIFGKVTPYSTSVVNFISGYEEPEVTYKPDRETYLQIKGIQREEKAIGATTAFAEWGQGKVSSFIDKVSLPVYEEPAEPTVRTEYFSTPTTPDQRTEYFSEQPPTVRTDYFLSGEEKRVGIGDIPFVKTGLLATSGILFNTPSAIVSLSKWERTSTTKGADVAIVAGAIGTQFLEKPLTTTVEVLAPIGVMKLAGAGYRGVKSTYQKFKAPVAVENIERIGTSVYAYPTKTEVISQEAVQVGTGVDLTVGTKYLGSGTISKQGLQTVSKVDVSYFGKQTTLYKPFKSIDFTLPQTRFIGGELSPTIRTTYTAQPSGNWLQDANIFRTTETLNLGTVRSTVSGGGGTGYLQAGRSRTVFTLDDQIQTIGLDYVTGSKPPRVIGKNTVYESLTTGKGTLPYVETGTPKIVTKKTFGIDEFGITKTYEIPTKITSIPVETSAQFVVKQPAQNVVKSMGVSTGGRTSSKSLFDSIIGSTEQSALAKEATRTAVSKIKVSDIVKPIKVSKTSGGVAGLLGGTTRKGETIVYEPKGVETPIFQAPTVSKNVGNLLGGRTNVGSLSASLSGLRKEYRFEEPQESRRGGKNAPFVDVSKDLDFGLKPDQSSRSFIGSLTGQGTGQGSSQRPRSRTTIRQVITPTTPTPTPTFDINPIEDIPPPPAFSFKLRGKKGKRKKSGFDTRYGELFTPIASPKQFKKLVVGL
jgi:hypothetical protein